MSSTYSTNLAIELIGTGDQAGTWGTTTNSNLGTLIEQSISGYVTQAVSTGTDTTITIPNGSSGVARNMYIELTGTGGASTNLIVPANKKLYFIFNNSTGAVTVKVSGQTGVSVPTGKKMVLVSNGTDIVNGLNYIADFASNSATITHLSATSATITNLTLTSLVISNLSIASANITTLTSASATITNLLATSLAVSSIATFSAGSAAAPSITTTGDTNTGLFFPAADTIAFTEGGVESMRIDSSGNLGLGVTPSAWSQFVAFEMGARGNSISSYNSGGVYVGSNCFFNGTNWIYKISSAAPAQYYATEGLHAWQTAAAGTAGNAITFSEKMRLDASGRLGIGASSVFSKLYLKQGADGTSTEGLVIEASANDNRLAHYYDATNNQWVITATYGSTGAFKPFTWWTSDTKRMTLDTSGNLGIGTASPTTRLDVVGLSSDSSNNFKQLVVRNDLDTDRIYMGAVASLVGSYIQNNAFYDSSFEFKPNDAASEGIHFQDGAIWFSTNSGLTSGVNFTPTERARITSGGNLLVGTTNSNPAGANVTGHSLLAGGLAEHSNDANVVVIVNRKTDDGELIRFLQAGASEGSISVSGATVSYNAFAGSHWSQLQDGSKPDILRGTVMESINELCVWPDEQNERLPKSKVSDTASSKKVYGVFMAWDNDWTTTNDMYVTAVGAFICRVNASVTVQEGDLLESNGDGTARVQADDIIRSSTIGKVTSTVKTHQYADGSYCVPTVLYCG